MFDKLMEALHLKSKSTETSNTTSHPKLSIKCLRCKSYVPYAEFMARAQTCVTYNCHMKKPSAREQISDRLGISPDDLIPVKSGFIKPYAESYSHKPLGYEYVD